MKYLEVKELLKEFFEYAEEELGEEPFDELQIESFLEDRYPCEHEDKELADCFSCRGTGEGATPDLICSSCRGSGVGKTLFCNSCEAEVE